MFDSHNVCEYDQENGCVFCSVRSLSLRMNDTKREPYITPHELLKKSIDTQSGSFSLLLEEVLSKMADSCCEFKKNMGLTIRCVSCDTVSKINENLINHCQVTEEKESIHSILEREIDKKLSSLKICCNNKGVYILDEDQKIIVLKFDGSFSNVKVENVNKVVGQEYRVLSFILANKRPDGLLKEEVHFKYGDFCLQQYENSLKLSNIAENQDTVCGIVLGKVEYVTFSRILPYKGSDFVAVRK